jgi:hypothetical protein
MQAFGRNQIRINKIDKFVKSQNPTQSRKARKVNLLILRYFLGVLGPFARKYSFCEFVKIQNTKQLCARCFGHWEIEISDLELPRIVHRSHKLKFL